MIVVTIQGQGDRQYLVRLQEKVGSEGEWSDAEIQTITGTSQPIAIDRPSTRLIVEDVSGVPLNVAVGQAA